MLTMKTPLQVEIEKKRSELSTLEGQIERMRSYIHGLETAQRLAEKTAASPPGERKPRFGSDISKCIEQIREAGHPLHINELLRALGKDVTKGNRMSLAGSLSTCVRDHKWFTRPGPNTFGLIDMRPANDSSADSVPVN